MKKLILTLTLVLGLTSCQNLQEGNDVQATFDANCETVGSSIDNFQNEVATYDEFSVDFVSAQTG